MLLEMLELVLITFFVSTINSDPSFSKDKDNDSPLLLSTSSAFLGSKLRFPELVRPLTYNVTVPLGATARLPCTVTNVEHQAVSIKQSYQRIEEEYIDIEF